MKAFVEEDLPKYDRTEYSFACVTGSGPIARLYSKEDEVLEEIQLEGKSRSELNELMVELGLPVAGAATKDEL